MATGPRANGNVFTVQRKARPNLPDARGTFELDGDFINAIRNAPKNENGKVVVEFAGWKKTGPRAGTYLGCSLSVVTESEHRVGRSAPINVGEPTSRKDQSDPFEDDTIPF